MQIFPYFRADNVRNITIKEILMNIPFLFIGYGEVLLILIVILLLFGGKKVPELMRGLGKGVRSFKEGLNGLDEDEKKTTSRQETDDAGRTTSRQESDKEGKTE